MIGLKVLKYKIYEYCLNLLFEHLYINLIYSYPVFEIRKGSRFSTIYDKRYSSTYRNCTITSIDFLDDGKFRFKMRFDSSLFDKYPDALVSIGPTSPNNFIFVP